MPNLPSALAASAISIAAAAHPLQTPVHGQTPGHVCEARHTNRFVGKLGTSMTGAAIKRVSRAAILRWAPPGTMLTMDFRADRVNVYVDDKDKVVKINCG